jgi:lipopolysaccharide export system protein LptA
MNRKVVPFLIIWVIFVSAPVTIMAQNQTDTTSTTIFVENSDNTIIEKSGDQMIRYLKGNIRVFHDSTYFYCDTAILYEKELFAYGNVVILQTDSTTIFSDSLYFNSDSSKALLNGRVLLYHQQKELRTRVLEYLVREKKAFYENKGQLLQDSTILKSKIGLYDLRKDMIYFKEHVSIIDSSFSLKADSLKYNAKSKLAIFTGPTVILQDSAQIYCEAGYYDIEENDALFHEKAIYLEKDKKASARSIEYKSEDELILLAGNARYQDEEQNVSADTIKYYRDEEMSILIGKVEVIGKGNNVVGDYIIYHTETGDFISKGRSTLSEENTILTADYIDFSEEKGDGIAYGDIILQDTSAKMEIHCDSLFTFDDNSRFKAFNDTLSRPLMKKIMDADTLFLSADTLYSYELIQTSDTVQMLDAYHQVRIFHEEFQAIADSMSYNSKDSSFVLFHQPVMWSDTSQFSGDTISIYMQNDKIEQLHLRPNALIINYQAGDLYNQIGGKTIRAYFRNDSIYRMTSTGNAESIYYLKDDENRFVGVIKTVCANMTFFFKGNDLSDVKYYRDPQSQIKSMENEMRNPQRLNGFRWEISKKPLSKKVDAIAITRHGNLPVMNQKEESDKESTENDTQQSPPTPDPK